MSRNSSAFLVLDYDKVVFRSCNSGSINIQIEFVLSAVWQLAAFKDNLGKWCKSINILKILYIGKISF